MKTKFILTINGKENELTSDCIANWDEVMCTYRRTDFSGVVRSISSKFQFAKDAYEMLLSAYLQDAVRTSASVAIFVLNDDWSWSKVFESALNFSTVIWDNYTFNINCIDDSLASLIKSRKSTKYEFEIGKEIEVGGILNFDRITMQNSCAHEIMGENDTFHKDGAIIIKHNPNLSRLQAYQIGDANTYENSPILSKDQDANAGGCFIEVVSSVSELHLRVEIWNKYAHGWGADSPKLLEIYLYKYNGDEPDFNNASQNMGLVYSVSSTYVQPSSHFAGTWVLDKGLYVGTYKTVEDLKRAHPNPPQGAWAIIGTGVKVGEAESVYITPKSNKSSLVKWELGAATWIGGRGNLQISTDEHKSIYDFELSNVASGTKFALFFKCDYPVRGMREGQFPIFSKITSEWKSRAKPIQIDSIAPKKLLSAICERIGNDQYNIIPNFSSLDPRLANTYILAAESVRNIPGAKIYTTFNDFCDWMEAVFGYVYTLGEPIPAQYNGMMPISGIDDDWAFDVGDTHGRVVDGYCPHEHYIEEPFFIRSHNCFCVWDNHETANMYTQWKDSYKYNDENGIGRKDLIFDDGRRYYVMGENDDLVEFVGDAKPASRITQSINFVHRSELFQNEEQGVVFYDAKEPNNKVNNSILYSVVEVGYEKQDYETECGRDEWNFMNYYNTGVDVIEKKLTLQSKYRADCYGLEFLSQERAKDSTDNKSDNTVFFVYTKLETKEEEQESGEAGSRGDDEEVAIQETTTLVIDRSAKIQGALTDTVFNGEFSPYYCVKANEGYISAVAPNVVLQFASSDGNSDIIIDGIKTTANIPLTQRLFSESEFKFVATDLERSIDFSKLIKVVSNGLIYSGFLKETEFCYPKPQEVKYTLIVKDIKPIC